jgi:hypothetical protein
MEHLGVDRIPICIYEVRLVGSLLMNVPAAEL